jgi:CMP-N-acetylneuraminic acid synthetase
LLKSNHYAIVPARRGSVGLPFKNRKFIEQKIKFLNNIKFFKEIIISSDDEFILNMFNKKKIFVIKRAKKISGSNVSIKRVFEDIVRKKKFSKNDILWLFYIPLLYNSKKLILKSKKIIEQKKNNSICGFIDVKNHPFNAWYLNKNKIKKVISNDSFRRQDLPKVLEHHHQICAFKAGEFSKLNSELINLKTYPIVFGEKLQKKLIEIDTKKDYLKYLKNEKKS